MATIKDLQEEVRKFRDERYWNKFHHTLDLAVAMNIESAEVLEHLRFKSREEVEEYLKDKNNKKEFSYELADVIIFMLAICEKENINLEEAIKEKLEINKKKYPVEKFKGRKDKYNKL